jgi:hypothetical protein
MSNANNKNRQKVFNDLIQLQFPQAELKVIFANIQHLITLIGENDNYTQVLKSFEGIDADDVSITNAQELRKDFVQQLIGQLAEFNIHLQPANTDKTSDKTIVFPVSQVA